ncbi:MAG TPA: hypothetical protein VJ654_06060, partial [Noviherbaspirillum sp.]|nr:hypothetical protein [Noviherbaspirillum sp.]
GSIQSAEVADAALEDVSRARAGVEASFAAEERACHPKFFVTSCVEQAQERRRQALQPLRKIELEANTFKRRERVSKRDDAAAERQVKAQAKEIERSQIKNDTKNIDGPAQERAPEAVQHNAPATNAERSAQHEAKLNRLQQEESKNAEKRSENVVAYEKKIQAAQERQKKVAERKAKKEAERRGKQASQPAAQ